MSKQWVLTQGLLLVPLVGASDSFAGALGLWLAWTLVILGHGSVMGLIRPRLTTYQRLLASVVLAATLATCAGFAVQAGALEMFQPLSLYFGWIALSCVVLEHEGFFAESSLPARLRLVGLFGLWMTGLGALRELTGSNIPMILLAPGGFILLGLLLAAHQAWTTVAPHSIVEEKPRP